MQTLEPGYVLGSYRIVRVLGQGAVGTVYEAVHSALGRTVALKTVLVGETATADAAARFQREARNAAALEHPNIIDVYDAGQQGEIAYLVMRYVSGFDLSTLLERRGGRLEPNEALDIARQVAKALDAAAQAGLTHRDVKPGNILLEERSHGGFHAWLADFGLTKRGGGDAITVTGGFVGTLLYTAPEQILGEAEPASDRYALGCVLWQMLAGSPPFQPTSQGSPLQLLEAHTRWPVPSIVERAGLPTQLDEVFKSVLSKKPQERPATAIAVVDAVSYAFTAPPVAQPSDSASAEQTFDAARTIRRRLDDFTPEPVPPPAVVVPEPTPRAAPADEGAAVQYEGHGSVPRRTAPPGPGLRWWWIGLGAVAVLGVLAVVVVLVSGGGGVPPEEQGEIAFVRDGQLLAARADGAGERVLVAEAVGDPAWSPLGAQIAFVGADGAVFVVPSAADGDAVQVTVGPDADPVWTADGQRLVLSRTLEDGTQDLFVLDVASGELDPLDVLARTAAGATAVTAADVSVEGALVFEVHSADGEVDLWTASSLTADPTPLVTDPGADLDPAWTPDGSAVVYARPDGPAVRVAPDGGEVVLDRFSSARAADVAPSGDAVVVEAGSPEEPVLTVVALDREVDLSPFDGAAPSWDPLGCPD